MTDEPTVEAAPEPPVIVARFVGDGSLFINGLPMRDITADDGIDPELLALGVAAGLYTLEG